MERGARWTGQISIFMFHFVHMIHIVHMIHAVPRIPPVHCGVLSTEIENLQKNMCFLTFFDIFGQIGDFMVETLQKWPLGGLLEASGGLWGPKLIWGGFGDVSFATETRNA